MLSIYVNGTKVQVEEGTSVAAAIINTGSLNFRRSVIGESRAPICGMGICYECRVKINGVPHQRSCMVACEEGMQVDSHA